MAESGLAEAPARPKPNRRGLSLHVYISPLHRRLMDQFVATARPRTDLTGLVEDALEEYFRARKLWPEPAE